MSDEDTKFFDRAIETLEEYTKKVKKLRKNYTVVKKVKLKNTNEMPPAGVKGSVLDTSMLQWKQTLRPYC
tara:strand:+ start:1726 stop:1935 length:210 start_codon:yes stop_codon:yes gene_type:complete